MRNRSNRIIVKGPGKEARPHSQIQATASKGTNRNTICSTNFLITFNVTSQIKCSWKHWINITLKFKQKMYLKGSFSEADLYWLYTLLQRTSSLLNSPVIWRPTITSCFSCVRQTTILNAHLKSTVEEGWCADLLIQKQISVVTKGWPWYVRVQEWRFPQITWSTKNLLIENQSTFLKKNYKTICYPMNYYITPMLFHSFSAEN